MLKFSRIFAIALALMLTQLTSFSIAQRSAQEVRKEILDDTKSLIDEEKSSIAKFDQNSTIVFLGSGILIALMAALGLWYFRNRSDTKH